MLIFLKSMNSKRGCSYIKLFLIGYVYLIFTYTTISLTFEHRFAEEQLDDVNPTQQSSQFSQGSQLTQQTDIMSKVNFLTLSEVNHVQHVRSFIPHCKVNPNILKAIIS